jgi:hypothetical protein
MMHGRKKHQITNSTYLVCGLDVLGCDCWIDVRIFCGLPNMLQYSVTWYLYPVLHFFNSFTVLQFNAFPQSLCIHQTQVPLNFWRCVAIRYANILKLSLFEIYLMYTTLRQLGQTLSSGERYSYRNIVLLSFFTTDFDLLGPTLVPSRHW